MTKFVITNCNIYFCKARNIISLCRFWGFICFSQVVFMSLARDAGWLALCLPVGGWKGVHQRALSNRKTAGALSCTSGRWKSGRGSGWSHGGTQRGGDLHTEVCPELDRHTSGHGWAPIAALSHFGPVWVPSSQHRITFIALTDWFTVSFTLSSPFL